jgi:hypothetical protein
MRCVGVDRIFGFVWRYPDVVARLSSAESDIRPLPPHFSHGAGYILTPGFVGRTTMGNPVPLHSGHLCSAGFGDGFFIGGIPLTSDRPDTKIPQQ